MGKPFEITPAVQVAVDHAADCGADSIVIVNPNSEKGYDCDCQTEELTDDGEGDDADDT